MYLQKVISRKPNVPLKCQGSTTLKILKSRSFFKRTTINHKMSTKNDKQKLILKFELDNPVLHETQSVGALLEAYLQSFHSLDITFCLMWSIFATFQLRYILTPQVEQNLIKSGESGKIFTPRTFIAVSYLYFC